MDEGPAVIRVGTSGWSYDDWRGIVYPERPRAAGLLAEHGVAVEANNRSLLLKKEDEERVVSMLKACAANRVPVAVNSDTHAALELGQDELALKAVGKAGVPNDLILTRSVETVLDFVERLRKNKLNYKD